MRRYFRAAAEAAQEVLAEQGEGTPDKTDLLRLINEAEDHQQPLTSPSKMVALQLAKGNLYFRYDKHFFPVILIVCRYWYMFIK